MKRADASGDEAPPAADSGLAAGKGPDDLGLSPEARTRQEELASKIDPERRKRLEKAYAPPRVIPE